MKEIKNGGKVWQNKIYFYFRVLLNEKKGVGLIKPYEREKQNS
jgi:hypothetical protein